MTTGSTGGYALDPDQLHDMTKRWQDILTRVKRYEYLIEFIVLVNNSARDDVTRAFTERVRKMGDGLWASHESVKRYTESYAAKLAGAQYQYRDAEEGVDAAFRGL